MFGILILGGITAALVAWSKRDKISGPGMGSPLGLPPMMGKALDGKTAKYEDSKVPTGIPGPPLQPEEERLLSLITLWVKDKSFPPGKKRFMTRALAVEAAKLAAQLGLVQTAKAILTDGRLPTERMGRRMITIREAVVAFNNNKD